MVHRVSTLVVGVIANAAARYAPQRNPAKKGLIENFPPSLSDIWCIVSSRTVLFLMVEVNPVSVPGRYNAKSKRHETGVTM